MKLLNLATCCAAMAVAGCASVPQADSGAVRVQILAINDFHGALQTPEYETSWLDDGEERRARLGGAARLATLLGRLRGGQDHSITVAAGDLISASPIISSRFLDEPAVAALNFAKLEVSSVGNHEFDRGVAELVRMQEGGCDRLTAREPCALEPYGGADFTYLAGNTLGDDDQTLFAGSVMRDFGPVTIGFVGLTLKDTGQLVPAEGIAGYSFTDEAEAANRLTADLLAQGADTVVLLIHEGAQVSPRNNLAGCPGLSGAVVPIVERLDPAIQLVISGHTHQAYSCEIGGGEEPLRLLTSAGSNGSFVTELSLSLDPVSGSVTAFEARNLPVTQDLPEDPQTAALVARYAAAASQIADRVVGSYRLAGEDADDCWDMPAQRLVADAQLAAAAGEEPADIAFVNSGGVRTPLAPGEAGTMTFGQIYAMQPFGNSLVQVNLTGDQLRRVLEQQFCDDEQVAPCFSYLIPSAGFAYSFDLSRDADERILAMTLGGAPIEPQRSYRVVIADFLQGGGDGFGLLAETEIVGGAGSDLDALEGWLADEAVIGGCGRVRDRTGAGA